MTDSLTDQQRELIADIAAVVLPGGGSQPAANEINLAQGPIDRVFESRPDLRAPFIAALSGFDNDSEAFLTALADSDYKLLMTVLCAAYLMDERVKKALYYPGQQALTPNRGGFGGEDLVIEMMQQSKKYRAV